MRNDEAVGCIAIFRREVSPFDERHIDLVATFADQAVIAIDNARLIEELRTQTLELTNSLEHQTATSEILQLIASSQTEIEPVLQTVAETTCRICEAYDAVITLRDGDWLRLAAHFGPIPFDVEGIPLDGKHSTSRAVLEGRPVHIDDILAVADEYPDAAKMAERTGWRTVLTVPLMKNGQAITSGEGDVNAHSRVQMALGEAKAKAKLEFKEILESTGSTLAEIRAFMEDHPETMTPLYKVPHYEGIVGTAAHFVKHIGERIKSEKPALVAV